MIEALTMANCESKIGQEDCVALLDFWREDCGTCRALTEELELLSKERPELKIFRINVEEEPELAKKYRVMMAPSLLVVKGGASKKKSLGFKSKEHILEMIEQFA